MDRKRLRSEISSLKQKVEVIFFTSGVRDTCPSQCRPWGELNLAPPSLHVLRIAGRLVPKRRTYQDRNYMTS